MRSATLNWSQGSHDVAAPIGTLRAIQDECGAGPEFIADALQGNSAEIAFYISPVVHGLVAGGMPLAEARQAADRAAEEKGLLSLKPCALVVMMLGLVGFSEEPDDGGQDDDAAGK